MIAAMQNTSTSRLSLVLPLVVLLALAGCGKADNEPGPGGVTVGEAKALDEAAQMLEDQRLPAEAVPAPRDGGAARSVVRTAAKPAG